MNTVNVNSSHGLTYGRIEPGSVFAFVCTEGKIGAPCFKLKTGYVILDTGEELQDHDRDKILRDEKCRFIQSVTITRA